jgi:hypothetical protein
MEGLALFGPLLGVGVIDEQARQVEQACHQAMTATMCSAFRMS